MHRSLSSLQHFIIVGTLLFILTVTSASRAAEAPHTEGLIPAVRERVRALSEGDKETWSRLTRADAFFVNDAGELLGHDAMLKSLSHLYPDVLSVVDDMVIRDLGADVVVSYISQEVETFPSGSVDRKIRRTETWTRIDGRWQMASGQATIIPYMHWQTVTVDTKLLDEYTGEYQWYPGKVDTVTREGSRLYSQWTSEPHKDELLAANENSFFARDDPSFVIFVRGPERRVTHYVLRAWDGQSLIAHKIK